MKDDSEASAAVKLLQAKVVAKHDALVKTAKAAFVPVKHTIVITEGVSGLDR
jgi:hypothetical protein